MIKSIFNVLAALFSISKLQEELNDLKAEVEILKRRKVQAVLVAEEHAGYDIKGHDANNGIVNYTLGQDK